MYDKLKNIDEKELQLPDTTYIRDIESKVFQGIVVQVLSQIEGICLLENSLFDSLLGRDLERLKGIYVEQDQKKHSVNVRVEVNVAYGLSIPKKAEEIQIRIVEEISTLTGLHVGTVHVVFKHLILPQQLQEEKELAKLEEEMNTLELEQEIEGSGV